MISVKFLTRSQRLSSHGVSRLFFPDGFERIFRKCTIPKLIKGFRITLAGIPLFLFLYSMVFPPAQSFASQPEAVIEEEFNLDEFEEDGQDIIALPARDISPSTTWVALLPAVFALALLSRLKHSPPNTGNSEPLR